MVAKGLQSASHPVLAQIVPIRRCNLACTYCNEFDDHLAPVPTDTMLERIDHLTRLGTANIEISGGEPLLHPDLDDIIRCIRHNGALAGLITNGYLLNERRIARFNDAGLDHLQISIDNVTPDDCRPNSSGVLEATASLRALVTVARRRCPSNNSTGNSKTNSGSITSKDAAIGAGSITRSSPRWRSHFSNSNGCAPMMTRDPPCRMCASGCGEIMAVLYIIGNRKLLNLIVSFQRNPPLRR